MSFVEYCKENNIVVDCNNIVFTERAERYIKRAHFTLQMLMDILSDPTKIEQEDSKIFILHGKRTAKINLEVKEDASILIRWFEYNKVQIFG